MHRLSDLWYLIAGSEPLAPGLQAALQQAFPMPPGRRELPSHLKNKDFFGGSLSYTGYDTHLAAAVLRVAICLGARTLAEGRPGAD